MSSGISWDTKKQNKLKVMENMWIHIPCRNDRTLRHTLMDNFLKVFIEILQSCYNPIYDISHAELWWENCKYVLKFTF